MEYRPEHIGYCPNCRNTIDYSEYSYCPNCGSFIKDVPRYRWGKKDWVRETNIFTLEYIGTLKKSKKLVFVDPDSIAKKINSATANLFFCSPPIVSPDDLDDIDEAMKIILFKNGYWAIVEQIDLSQGEPKQVKSWWTSPELKDSAPYSVQWYLLKKLSWW